MVNEKIGKLGLLGCKVLLLASVLNIARAVFVYKNNVLEEPCKPYAVLVLEGIREQLSQLESVKGFCDSKKDLTGRVVLGPAVSELSTYYDEQRKRADDVLSKYFQDVKDYSNAIEDSAQGLCLNGLYSLVGILTGWIGGGILGHNIRKKSDT